MASVSQRDVPTLNYLRNRLEPINPDGMTTAVETMIKLFKEDKIMAAGKLLEQIDEGIAKDPQNTDCVDAVARIGNRGEFGTEVKELRAAHAQCREALVNLWDLGSGWMFSQERFGAKTWYKVDVDHPSHIEVLSEAVYEECDLAYFMATMREFQYFKTYMPFTSDSKVLKRVSRSCNLVWFQQPMPMMNRDAVMYQRIVDCMDMGFMLVTMRAVDSYPGFPLPVPKGLLVERLDMVHWDMIVEPMGRGKFLVKGVLKANMKAPIPASVMNFITRKMAGATLPLMKRAANKARDQPNKSPYPPSMAGDPETWDWLHAIISRRIRITRGKHSFKAAPPPMMYAMENNHSEESAELSVSDGDTVSEPEDTSWVAADQDDEDGTTASRRRRRRGSSKEGKGGSSRGRRRRSGSSGKGKGGAEREQKGTGNPQTAAESTEQQPTATTTARASGEGAKTFTVNLTKRVAHSSVIFYSIDVTGYGVTKTILRRYSDFVTLNGLLRASGVRGNVPLPPKIKCSNFFFPSDRTLSLRQSSLSSYLQEVMRDEEAMSLPTLREFLQLDSFGEESKMMMTADV